MVVALVACLAPADTGCGQCLALCFSGIQLNVTLPASFDPEAAFAGTVCVGTDCGDFAFAAGSLSRPTCVEPDSATQADMVCLRGSDRDGGHVSRLEYTFLGSVDTGEAASFRVTDATGSTVFFEQSVTLAPQHQEVCGQTCVQQTLDL